MTLAECSHGRRRSTVTPSPSAPSPIKRGMDGSASKLTLFSTMIAVARSTASAPRPHLPAPRHLQAPMPDQRQPDLRLDAFGQTLAAASLVATFLSRPGLATASLVRGRESCFIAPG